MSVLEASYYHSPLGKLLLVAKDGSLSGLWMEGQKYYLSGYRGEIPQNRESPVLQRTSVWLDRYFRGECPDPGELPLAPVGSEFRQEVWKLLREIPYGKTTTYREIAEKIAEKRGLEHMSAQAVGGAVGHNPISIIIPCHRVVGTDGGLTGYAGGIHKKRWLLLHERGLNPQGVWKVTGEALQDSAGKEFC